ncbi:hypothetical protein ANANG_G00112510 [Anguilla anguilla]|uniref:Uncharacterized protein n=1 Tax=Anguilla anguilla TaxID=7936 RepID=A0A9D3S016_ANGAN|nr:hypothetical protein ANANG_G00112510 [Anguilla anguilla]
MNKKIKPRLLEKRKKGRRKERLHEERNRQINDSVKNKRLRQNRKNLFVYGPLLFQRQPITALSLCGSGLQLRLPAARFPTGCRT